MLDAARCEEAAAGALAVPRPVVTEAQLECHARPAPEGAVCASEGAPPAPGAAAAPGATVVSQPISFGELAQGVTFQLVVTLRPCPPASTGERA